METKLYSCDDFAHLQAINEYQERIKVKSYVRSWIGVLRGSVIKMTYYLSRKF
jgi:hypothetical protein